MKLIKSERVLDILYLILFLLLVVVWGSSTALVFIEYSTIMAIICVVSYFVVFAGIFLLKKRTRRYKWKFLFLGKKFKSQADEFFARHKELSKKERKDLLKTMKDTYRKTGHISLAVYHYQITPYKIWSSRFDMCSIADKSDEEKMEFILYELQLNCDYGGGLYRSFESLCEKISYKEFARLVRASKLISKEFKEMLLSPEKKKAYEYMTRYNDLTDEEHNFLERFELNGSDDIYEYGELLKIIDKLAVEFFLKNKQKDGMPENVEKLFISKDGMSRAYIYKDAQSGAYKAGRETFTFYDEGPASYSEGGWHSEGESSSFYDSVKTAFGDIKSYIKDYEEVVLDTQKK